ncbi:MAG: prolyl oligopeptidase family serine peptidase [Kiritimatiellaeota bacterium]|nr:prolyl oligopeptidase family serine peptidase [Kiritimatiellota bacterium]
MIFAQTALELTTAEAFTVPEVGTLPYRQRLTPNLPQGQKVPLILFLHGLGECGNDNAAQLKHGVADLITFADANGGALIIAPQCPEGEKWVSNIDPKAATHTMPAEPSAPMKLVLALLNEKTEKMPVDPDRIYVTGLSMGGYGTWDIIQRRPKLFAAALPICGGGDPTLTSAIKGIPVWIFHGAADDTVPVARAHDMRAALKAAGGSVQYREYEGVGHDSWTQTYADPDVLKWLLGQRRQNEQKN